MTSEWDRYAPSEAWRPYVPTAASPWNESRAAHLLRRAGFGATRAQLDAAVRRGPQATVDELLTARDEPKFDATLAAMASSLLAASDARSLAAWWLYRIAHTAAPLRERMTLFWHGHFATSGAKVDNARLLLSQHEMLRQHALGKFRDLAHGISRDSAMLLYLDSATNRRSHPNENFARELLELFCLGLGHYTERDIQQLARCFTGWEVRNNTFRFNRYQHDPGEKDCFGRRGAFTGEQAVDIVLEQPAVASYLVAKLVHEFVTDEPALPDALVAPLVERFRATGYDLADLVGTILSSRLMLEQPPRGAKVRSPIAFAVGWLRSLDGATSMPQLANDLEQMGQLLFYPPNVKGWPGGRAWINSSTLVARANLIARWVDPNAGTRFGGTNLIEWTKRQGWRDADEIVDGFARRLLALPLPDAARSTLVQMVRERPEPAAGASAVLHALSLLPESHLE